MVSIIIATDNGVPSAPSTDQQSMDGSLGSTTPLDNLRLATWKASGISSGIPRDFKNLAGVNAPIQHTSWAGNDGPAGVGVGRLIHSLCSSTLPIALFQEGLQYSSINSMK